MSQAIIRLCTSSHDAELCIKRGSDTIFKKLSIEKVLQIIKKYNREACTDETSNIALLNEQIIGLSEDYAVIKQPEHKRIVTLFDKSYKINFPNAIYIVHHQDSKIKKITAFSYKEYKGLETDLYEYPMPNELTGNTICMGSAKREITNNDYVVALERVIATPYSHANFSGIKGFTNSQKWFEYLSKNEFPYKLMRSLNKKLKDIEV